MYIYKLPNAAASKPVVTSTATLLDSLIGTAASASFSFPVGANAIDITPEDGDIRVTFDGNTPTSANGLLLKSGSFYAFRGVPLTKMRLIRVSGNVTCSIQIGRSEANESTAVGLTSASVSVTADTEFPTAAALSDNFANPTTTTVGAMNMLWDGATWDRAPGNATDGMLVNLGSNNDVVATLESNSMAVAGAAVTPKFAAIDVASSGDNTIVSAVASKKIRVTSLFLVASAAVTVRFESGAGGTALTGQMQLAANGGFSLPYNPNGWFETASNTLLNLELSGATSVDGALTYIEV